ncbi:MAG: TetR/AcrR family transcriptional regulator [Cellulosilyticum sp.]|nr:TetR/AcrR family transcriptional regulator [Cellulosilyticum sp.]
MNTTNGKMAIQSRQKLADALFIIMQQYNFKEITITQIAQEAKLSRKTFYRLYNNKEEILDDFFQNLFESFIKRVKDEDIHHYWDAVQVYFDFWEEKREFLRLLKKQNILTILMNISYNRSFEVFEYVRSKEIMVSFSPYLPYLISYALGGMHSMLIKWIEEDMAVPSSVLIEKLKAGFQSVDI